MSDFDDDGRRIPDQDELELAYEQRKRMSLCEACARGDHANCGMQTWCDCDCDPEMTLIECKLDKSACDHDWKHGDGRDDDVCTKCGQNFLSYVFMEAP